MRAIWNLILFSISPILYGIRSPALESSSVAAVTVEFGQSDGMIEKISRSQRACRY